MLSSLRDHLYRVQRTDGELRHMVQRQSRKININKINELVLDHSCISVSVYVY